MDDDNSLKFNAYGKTLVFEVEQDQIFLELESNDTLSLWSFSADDARELRDWLLRRLALDSRLNESPDD